MSTKDIIMKEETEHESGINDLVSKNEMLSNLEGPNLTFQIHEEDHTLGNALRHLAMLNPYTTFAGYAIPHPSISIMNLRIETLSNVETEQKNFVLDLRDNSIDSKVDKKKNAFSVNNIGATYVLLKSCDDLDLICNAIENKFNDAIKLFYSNT